MHLRFLWDPRRSRLSHAWCFLVSVSSDSSALYFLMEAPLRIFWALSGKLTWHFLGILWHALLAYSRCYLACFSGYLLPGEILFAWRYQWLRKPIVPGLFVWTVCVSSTSSLIFLGGLTGLLKALAELSRIDCPTVGISSDRHTGYVIGDTV